VLAINENASINYNSFSGFELSEKKLLKVDS